MKNLLILFICLFSTSVFAGNPHHHGGTTTNNTTTDNSVVNNYYTTEVTEVTEVNEVIDEQFKISTAMGLAASGVRFRARESLQWGAAMSRYEDVGALGIGLMQQITDKKLELSGKFVFEDKNKTKGWVIGISGGFK